MAGCRSKYDTESSCRRFGMYVMFVRPYWDSHDEGLSLLPTRRERNWTYGSIAALPTFAPFLRCPLELGDASSIGCIQETTPDVDISVVNFRHNSVEIQKFL